jgi:hypothetical protein
LVSLGLGQAVRVGHRNRGRKPPNDLPFPPIHPGAESPSGAQAPFLPGPTTHSNLCPQHIAHSGSLPSPSPPRPGRRQSGLGVAESGPRSSCAQSTAHPAGRRRPSAQERPCQAVLGCAGGLGLRSAAVTATEGPESFLCSVLTWTTTLSSCPRVDIGPASPCSPLLPPSCPLKALSCHEGISCMAISQAFVASKGTGDTD